ncbi:MAG: hypothetical protein GEV03_07465 [Streptosporangiales bacterium]|nr:hypothetical protein [Streptosporangiales bacterium]
MSDNEKPSAKKLGPEEAGILAYLTGDNESGDKQDSPSSPPRRARRSSTSRKPRVTYDREFPVETRNRYDGTHEGLRDRALQEAIKRGVDPATVRATGPGSFEFDVS